MLPHSLRRSATIEYEGAFRSWLVRIVIDEALLILVERKRDLTTLRDQALSE
jgi:hypothetical protein